MHYIVVKFIFCFSKCETKASDKHKHCRIHQLFDTAFQEGA